jgi:hypothetical protein
MRTRGRLTLPVSERPGPRLSLWRAFSGGSAVAGGRLGLLHSRLANPYNR